MKKLVARDILVYSLHYITLENYL